MKIAYIILTCEKYMNTRVLWQLKTMLATVDRSDIYYLSHTMDVDKRLFSWGAGDDYNSLPYKFVDFFRNSDLTYDWYVLIDDDTFVFHDRLLMLLSAYDPTQKVCIGKELDHIQHMIWGLYMSGGAGTVISYPVYKELCMYMKLHPNTKVICHWCADICLGMWMKQLTGIQMVNHSQFHTDRYDLEKDSAEDTITFHHLNTWEDYELCDRLMKHGQI